ncbi:hypothetical protein IV203_013675 [Nitzschia inconspicua]|uniref:TFA2 Winged helix domain-containing protein n=1 Tax=Nitzschia inconspicua TaxID=303405 RepID=A0A9K3M780_9STRA|nr:hypothetical protein IV203_013675 [Nitzschia inconspicua]
MSQSNRYGLDFLRTEHTLGHDGTNNNRTASAVDSSLTVGLEESTSSWTDPHVLAAAAAHKPDLEKQFDVMHFLKAHRSSGWMPPSVIYQRTGIDLETDIAVAEMLQRNPKIAVEHVPDPENPSLRIATYAYQAKYNHVRDRKTLLAQINRSKNGIGVKDLQDAYDGVEDDLDALICAGDVLALSNNEDKDKILFPRGEPFFVELDGIITLPSPKRESVKAEETDEQDTNQGEKKSEETTVKGSDNSGGNVTPPAMNGDSKLSPASITNGNKKLGTKQEDEPAVKMEDVNRKNGSENKEEEEEKKTEQTSQTSSTKDSQLKPQKYLPIYLVETDSDPLSQIWRGEAIQIGGTWFRVSSAVKEGSLKDQPARAQAPLSVVMREPLSKRNELDGYIRPFTEKTIPADASLPPSAIINLQKAKEARERLLKVAHGRAGGGGVASQLLGSNAHASNPVALAASFGTGNAATRRRPLKGGATGGSSAADAHRQQQEAAKKAKEAALDPYLSLYTHARRHGCTKDVRELYIKTRSKIPNNDAQLKAMLVEHKLLDPGEEMRRPRLQKRANVDNDGKPKKRRYYERKNQRMTNTHLEGTEIGAILHRAAEKQREGKQVGDGGM